MLYYPVYTYGVSNRIKNVQIDSLNRPSERFESIAEWYSVNTRRVPCKPGACQCPTHAPRRQLMASGQKPGLRQEFLSENKDEFDSHRAKCYIYCLN